MKKRSSIIKLALVGVVLVFLILCSVCKVEFSNFYNYNSFAGSIKLGLDLKGGVYAVYEAENDGIDNFDAALEGTQTRLQDMLVSEGYSEAIVTIEGDNRLRVEVPDVDNPSEIFELIGKPAELVFKIDGKEVFRGDYITNAVAGYNQEGNPAVSLEMTEEGGKIFYDVTKANVNKTMSIYSVVEGEETLISSATINEAIAGGKAQISMSGEFAAAENLASQIMAGTFDLKLSLKESSTISPTLGDQALFYGILAGAIGLLLVIIFLIARYRLFGVVATIALALYTVLMLMFLAILPWVQLTLPGIAGIVLSLGMAVDGNIVIYERIRDEYRDGKSILAATHAGFKKATVAIVDSNITTIIASIVLLIFGTGSISGFGLTLLIGIILSMFTSVFVTRFLCKCFTALNNTNEKLYALKRGENYVPPVVESSVEANDVPVEVEVAEGGNA